MFPDQVWRDAVDGSFLCLRARGGVLFISGRLLRLGEFTEGRLTCQAPFCFLLRCEKINSEGAQGAAASEAHLRGCFSEQELRSWSFCSAPLTEISPHDESHLFQKVLLVFFYSCVYCWPFNCKSASFHSTHCVFFFLMICVGVM